MGGYSREALERSAAGKDEFFSRKLAENAARPDHLPPSQGGKYVGFGSTPAPSAAGGSSRGGGDSELVDAAWDTVSAGISKLTVVASAAASAVKPGLQEVTQRYQRGELASTAAQLAATGADLGLRGLSSLKGLLKNAVTQLDAYANDNPNATGCAPRTRRARRTAPKHRVVTTHGAARCVALQERVRVRR